EGPVFLIKYADGSGGVLYPLRSPSGNPAIVITPAEYPHFIYVILEDKDKKPRMIGIFTPKGCATCYRSNGLIWLNITSSGGFCFGETGELRRRWNWLYFDPHVHNLPFKPLIFAMGPCISIHIHSQECVYVNFMYKENHVRFSVGSELELTCPESHAQLGQSILEREIQMQKTRIYCLLDQMQTCMS
uniref:FAM194 C-terminal domain-containing protein n=1 Tax=Poecilia formosa TaxID=48698 RepID=A0A096LXC3_POEFO